MMDDSHIVTFDKTGWTIRHPLRERIDECDLNHVCAEEMPGPPPQLGRYLARQVDRDGEWRWQLSGPDGWDPS